MTTETNLSTPSQTERSEKAMDLKSKATGQPHPESGRTEDEGMTPKPRTGIAPSGAFGAEGQRPVLERSHKVR